MLLRPCIAVSDELPMPSGTSWVAEVGGPSHMGLCHPVLLCRRLQQFVVRVVLAHEDRLHTDLCWLY